LPNIRSAEKRLRQSAKRRLRNVSVRSRMKTEVKKAQSAIGTKDATAAAAAFRAAVKRIDKAASKGVVHRNAAARRKSRLARKLNAIA
jgi:small subunit ribosomal protein S20